MSLAPIALFAYCRPKHLRNTVESLRADPLAAASDLHIFCDAARKSEGAEAVAEVRRYVRTIAGFRSVSVIERERNFGLARSVMDGVTSLCGSQGRVIVVEDDLLVAKGFLGFLNKALDRYASEERVMQVSGYQFPGEFGDGTQAVFLPIINCWGWATWQRAWHYYDPDALGAQQLKQDHAMRKRFNLDGAYDYYSMLEEQLSGRLDSWGVRWLLSVFLREGLVLYPPATLVQNAGVDGSGTHGAGIGALQTVVQPAVTATHWRLPESIELDARSLTQVQQLLRAQRPGMLKRLIRKLVA